MPNPFEGQTLNPVQADIQLARTELEKDLSTIHDAAGRRARLQHLLASRSIFIDPSAANGIAEGLDKYRGDDPVGFVTERASEVWKREGKYDDPLKYKAHIFRADREKDGYVFINDVFYYATEHNLVHIHLNNPYAYAEADTPGAKIIVLRSFIKGLSELANRLRDTQDVNTIRATSPLLTNPMMAKLLESAGFRNLGTISDEMRQKYFSNEPRTVSWMEADRNEFCEKAKNAKDLQTKLLATMKSGETA